MCRYDLFFQSIDRLVSNGLTVLRPSSVCQCLVYDNRSMSSYTPELYRYKYGQTRPRDSPLNGDEIPRPCTGW